MSEPSSAIISRHSLDILTSGETAQLLHNGCLFTLSLAHDSLTSAKGVLPLSEHLVPLTPTLEPMKITSLDSKVVTYVELPVDYHNQSRYIVKNGYCDGQKLYVYSSDKRYEFPLPAPVTPTTALNLLRTAILDHVARLQKPPINPSVFDSLASCSQWIATNAVELIPLDDSITNKTLLESQALLMLEKLVKKHILTA